MTEHTQAQESEREAFEAELGRRHPEWAFTSDPVFDYHNERTRCAWEAWQARAALASRSTEPGGEAIRIALEMAVRQNSHDMLMTGEELRQCSAALAALKPKAHPAISKAMAELRRDIEASWPDASEPKTYDEIYEWCLSHPADFSNEQAHAIACHFAPKESK